jgi:hypothetical protein
VFRETVALAVKELVCSHQSRQIVSLVTFGQQDGTFSPSGLYLWQLGWGLTLLL